VPRVKSKSLFELIKSLNKNEKRYFKVINAGSGIGEDKKILILFDYLSAQEDFNEDNLLKKEKSIKPEQLSNLKAYLFEKILQSIRQYNSSKISDIRIREQIDFAQILFEKRLYSQGIKCLNKAKKLACNSNNLELQLEIIKFEKSILMQTIDHDNINKVDRIISEARSINAQINNINNFSNLEIKLNSFYTKIGFIRDETDFLSVKEFFKNNIPEYKEEDLSLIEKIHLYRLYIGYYFFVQDFLNGYTFASKLVSLFESSEELIRNSMESYIKSLNSLLIAQNKLLKYHEFVITNEKLQSIDKIAGINLNENIRIRLKKYYYIHQINKFFMTGEFDQGVNFIIEEKAEDVQLLIEMLDKHSALIMNYKIACLYFGAGDFHTAIKWLNKIINIPQVDIREDLHCFARIINLICHYELGNNDVINYYILSTYRFLLKKEDLHLFQKFILLFLKNLNRATEADQHEMRDRFTKLKMQLLPLVSSEYEKRVFIYFDIISWLESKVEQKSVQEVIMKKSIAVVG
jgi:hypothetical protein